MIEPEKRQTKSFSVGGIRVIYLVGPKQDICENVQAILDKVKSSDIPDNSMMALRIADMDKGLSVRGFKLVAGVEDYLGAAKEIGNLVQIDNTAAMVEEIDEVNRIVKTAHEGRDN